MSTKQTILIEGMGCDHCVKAVREAIDGVKDLHASYVEIGKAVVETERDSIDMAKLEKAIEESGYTITNS